MASFEHLTKSRIVTISNICKLDFFWRGFKYAFGPFDSDMSKSPESTNMSMSTRTLTQMTYKNVYTTLYVTCPWRKSIKHFYVKIWQFITTKMLLGWAVITQKYYTLVVSNTMPSYQSVNSDHKYNFFFLSTCLLSTGMWLLNTTVNSYT